MRTPSDALCRICGGSLHSVIVLDHGYRTTYREQIPLYRCVNCGHIVSNRKFTELELIGIYQDYARYGFAPRTSTPRVACRRRATSKSIALSKSVLKALLLGDEDPLSVLWKQGKTDGTLYSSALDVGAGAGAHAIRLRDMGFQVSACDLDGHAVDKLCGIGIRALKQKCPHVLPFGDGSFDFVFAWQVIEHVDNYEAFLAEMHRVCRAGGVVALATPNANSRWRDYYQENWESGYYFPLHLNIFSERSLLSVLERAQLRACAISTRTPYSWFKLNEVGKRGRLSVTSRLAGNFRYVWTKFNDVLGRGDNLVIVALK